MSASLLPCKLELSSQKDVAAASANLMPFSIEYDGFAPIDSFMLLRKAVTTSDSTEPVAESYTSAFRGRTIQSTPLVLPPRYQAHVVQISQIASTSSAIVAKPEPVIPPKAAPKEYRPAKQQKFSMDSDDDDEDDEPELSQGIADVDVHMVEKVEGGTTEHSKQDRVKVVMSQTAAVPANELRVWGADGPIDRGDDPYFKTVDEWLTVVGPLLHS